jgi:hypothetical protein
LTREVSTDARWVDVMERRRVMTRRLAHGARTGASSSSVLVEVEPLSLHMSVSSSNEPTGAPCS